MLTPADDYPIHQLPVPVAHTGAASNFYDRYWFNGYDPQSGLFWAAGLAVYPGLDLMDAAFAVCDGATQHNLRASRHLGGDRMATQVGPLSVEILKPLHSLRLRADDNGSGIAADLRFTGRHPPVEEPRHGFRAGARQFMDATRMTQLGRWQGSIRTPDGQHQVQAGTRGTRDRSWGYRPVGAPPAQHHHDQPPPQFYWLWAPLHFASGGLLWYRNEDAQGQAWNAGASWSADAPAQAAEPLRLEQAGHQIAYQQDPATRRMASLSARMLAPGGRPMQLELAPAGRRFYMCGIGYMHPEWGHGAQRGELDVGWDSYDLADLAAPARAQQEQAPPFNHIQELVRARLTLPDGGEEEGTGVLEQLILGPHAPSGFTSLVSAP